MSAAVGCVDGVRGDAGLAAVQLCERGHTPPDDMHKARALCADGRTEWRCQLALQRQATRVAGLPAPMNGRESRREGARRKPELRRAATARGGSGGEAAAATQWRPRAAGCLLARVARAVGEGSKSDAEALRDEENAPRVGRLIGRVNVDDSVAAVPHTPHHTKSRVGSRGPVLCL